MKLDSEQPIYAHSTLPQKPDSHFFIYNKSTVETAWKMNNEIMGEDKRKIVSDPDIKKCDTNSDSLLTKEEFGDVKDVSQRHGLVAVENSVDEGGLETENPFGSNDIKLSEIEIELYTDKSVTESELPELMVSYKEFEDGNFHAVKDICIDEGLPSLGKILVDNGEVVNEGVFSSMRSDLAKQNLENVATISNGTNPFVEYDGETDIANKNGSEQDSGEEGVNVDCAASSSNGTNPFVECDNSSTDPPARKLDSESSSENGDKSCNENMDSETPILNGTNPFLECDSDKDVAKESGEDDCDKIVNGDTTDETTMPVTLARESDVIISSEPSDKAGDQQQSDQDRSKEAQSADSMTPCTLEESKEVAVTHDSDSSSPASSGKEEDQENKDGQQSTEEENEDSRTASSRSFFIQHGYGETSFGPLSGSIVAHSGQYSGNISLRSDSSTTSTRSFAFPVLNTEWTASPVRMAKADKSNFRKHRGWKIPLMCCRF